MQIVSHDLQSFENEDRENRERVDSRNRLETYLFQVKQSLQDYGSRLSPEDRDEANSMVEQTLRWLENNQTAGKDEFEHRLNEVKFL